MTSVLRAGRPMAFSAAVGLRSGVGSSSSSVCSRSTGRSASSSGLAAWAPLPKLPCRRRAVVLPGGRTASRALPELATGGAPAALPPLSSSAIPHLGAYLATHEPIAAGGAAPAEIFQLSDGLEAPIQLLYLLTLLAFLSAGAFLVVRQVLIRRELDESAKGLGERIRTGEATCEDYFELGVVLTRKRLFTQATKNLEKAKKVWDGEEGELAQVHNALGFCYLNMEQNDAAVKEFKRAVELQPGYVTAWNNLGDAYERTKAWRSALSAYQEALSYAPSNDIARQRTEFCKTRVERLGL